jgi:hypothetical protein
VILKEVLRKVQMNLMDSKCNKSGVRSDESSDNNDYATENLPSKCAYTMHKNCKTLNSEWKWTTNENIPLIHQFNAYCGISQDMISNFSRYLKVSDIFKLYGPFLCCVFRRYEQLCRKNREYRVKKRKDDSKLY